MKHFLPRTKKKDYQNQVMSRHYTKSPTICAMEFSYCTSKTAMNCTDPTQEYCGSGKGLHQHVKFSAARYFLSGMVYFSRSPEIRDQLL